MDIKEEISDRLAGDSMKEKEEASPDRIFASTIAHDLNNILTTISGYTEMLSEDFIEGSQQKEASLKILSAVAKAKSLTDKIISYHGDARTSKTVVNINEVIGESIDYSRSSMPSGIAVQCSLGNKDIPVFAEPLQLVRVFLNIINNAFRAMEEKGGILSVSVEVMKKENMSGIFKNREDIVSENFVKVSFKDSGKGIESSIIDRIFEPFFTSRESGQGRGLGLFIVKGIVHELNGEICVASNKENGTVFDVILPVYKEYDDETLFP